MLNTSHGVPATPSHASGKTTRSMVTPAHSVVPPPAPTSHIAPVSAPQSQSMQYNDAENLPPGNTGRDSEGTMYTSMTEIKDRSSNGSATVVRETIQ